MRAMATCFAFTLCLAIGALTLSAPVQADDTSCTAAAADKKLAGAARTSFMRKCEADAKTRCDAAAADKKLAGAAKTSFTRKCLSDALGA